MTPELAFVFLWRALAFGLAFGILVFVHEFGHFAVAKMCGVTVEVFSFGFGRRLLGFRRKGTDYRVSLVPLGGYVKLLGETTEDELQGDPGEFQSKPKWQRFLVLVAGAAMNIVLALACYTAVFTQGDRRPLYLDEPVVVGGVTEGAPAEAAGVKPGDHIVEVDGVKVEKWADFVLLELLKPDKPVVLAIERDGQRQTITVTAGSFKESVTNSKVGNMGIEPIGRVIVLQVSAGSPAEKAGVKPDDVVVSIDGAAFRDVPSIIRAIRASEGKVMRVLLERAGKPVEIEVTAVRNEQGRWQMGFLPDYEYRIIHYTWAQAFPRAVREVGEQTTFTYFTLKSLLTRDVSLKQVSGPIGIFQFTGKAAESGFDSYLRVIGLISLQLGIINLLPIPVLDGGHIFILLIEGMLRRDLSVKLKERMIHVGFFFLMALMVVVIFNDISKNVPGGLDKFLPWGGP